MRQHVGWWKFIKFQHGKVQILQYNQTTPRNNSTSKAVFTKSKVVCIYMYIYFFHYNIYIILMQPLRIENYFKLLF